VRDAAQAARGLIRITAPLTFGTLHLARRLAAFALDYPEISLDVAFRDRLVNLVDEGFDVAIRIGRPADSSLIARALCAVRLVLVASDAYLAWNPPPERPGDLAGTAASSPAAARSRRVPPPSPKPPGWCG
jgi:DNA-binding transcriptional LysR family regulator